MVWSRVSLDLEPGANPSGGSVWVRGWGGRGWVGGSWARGYTTRVPQFIMLWHQRGLSGQIGGGEPRGGDWWPGRLCDLLFSPKRWDNVCMYVGERKLSSPSIPCILLKTSSLDIEFDPARLHIGVTHQLGWGVSSSQASDQSWQILCFSFSPSLLSLLSPFLWLLSVFLLGLPTRWQHQSLSEVGLEAKGDFWGRLVWEHSRLVLLDSISTHIINVMGVVFHACRQWHDVMKSKVTEKKNTKSKHFNDKWKNGFESL